MTETLVSRALFEGKPLRTFHHLSLNMWSITWTKLVYSYMVQINYTNIYRLNNYLLYEAEKKLCSYIFLEKKKQDS
jgi:hypothetical protein